MNRQSVDTIHELEDEYNEELDVNFDAGADGLCFDTHCHEACDCQDTFESAVREQLEKQQREWSEKAASMRSLYNAEVSAGIYVPTIPEERR